MTYKTKSFIYFSVFIATALVYYITDSSSETEKEIYVSKEKVILESTDTITTTAEINLEDKE
ncbi:hypothetical protein CLV91_1487 [Maribacter vaceletii]|uniref:Uncharacterized protein n=1 Tax=Maribacter vaceletii TaxID=1206816 RepID=A0A495EFG2_9FLAO|nr:hypothetical protein [Maribacter vaceletii]RKR15401.1 hypothetical protein CLV91_1487 [Maribacter vaceletii]